MSSHTVEMSPWGEMTNWVYTFAVSIIEWIANIFAPTPKSTHH